MKPQPIPQAQHSNPFTVLIVAAAGFFGTAARELLEQVISPSASGFPWATWIINISGSVALGVLLGLLFSLGPDQGLRRRVRLILGTGFLGAFTTYSTFVVETDLLIKGGQGLTAVLYALSTLLLGLALSWSGILLGGKLGGGPVSAPAPIDPEPENLGSRS